MLENFRHKHILFDTCVIIDAAKHQTEFAVFLNWLRDLEMASVIDSGIKLEFLRGSTTKEALEAKEDYLDLLLGEHRLELSYTNEIFSSAMEISNIYTRLNKAPQNASIVDLLIASQMKKYSGTSNKLFLATSNHQDFPLQVFDRDFIHTIDAGERIFNIGIYSFNNTKFEKYSSKFNR